MALGTQPDVTLTDDDWHSVGTMKIVQVKSREAIVRTDGTVLVFSGAAAPAAGSTNGIILGHNIPYKDTDGNTLFIRRINTLSPVVVGIVEVSA